MASDRLNTLLVHYNGQLQQLQQIELEMLLVFKNVCEAHTLRYYLTAGTLLGAVRHKGFIPWDDDIDIAMPREDFDRLIRLCQEELDTRFFFQSSDTDPFFPLYFAKLRLNDTATKEAATKNIPMHQGLFIDIFPLDVCPDSETGGQLFFKAIEFFSVAARAKVDREFSFSQVPAPARWLLRLATMLPVRGLYRLRDIVRRWAAFCGSGRRICTVGGAHLYPYEVFQSKWYHSTVSLEFEGHVFPAPAEWDEYLKHMYGEDYMVPPPPELRRQHQSFG